MSLEKNTNNFATWVDEVVKNKITSEKEARFDIKKEAIGNNRQDLSRPTLENLLHDGYQTVQWNSGMSNHSVCVELNNQQWTLEDFLSGLVHDAPIFERSHPGDNNCSVVVMGDGLPNLQVDSFGNVQEV
jgi:hypothetical protein